MEFAIQSAKAAMKSKPAGRATQLNQYTILRKLGSGAYGTVKHCVSDGEDFAVKIYSKTALQRKREVKRVGRKMTIRTGLDDVKDEIRIQQKLTHKNILKTIEVLEDDEHIYVVLEYCAHGAIVDYDDIDNEFKSSEGFKPLEIHGYVQQLKDAISYLQSMQITHRDIKPQNILLTADGTIKIADFGKAYEGESNSKLSPATISFSPPEYYSGHPADIWALGISIYIMMYNELPFRWDNLDEMLEVLQSFELDLPENCDEVIKSDLESMLNRDPIQRSLHNM